MTLLAGAVLLLATGGGVDAPADGARARVEQVQVRIRRQRGIVRVLIPRDARPERPMRWRERRGPRCIATDALAGARVNEEDSVDLLLRDGARVRAELESRCPALDYYSGFYLKPGSDERICADRDTIHSRAGGQCEIERFRSLVPER